MLRKVPLQVIGETSPEIGGTEVPPSASVPAPAFIQYEFDEGSRSTRQPPAGGHRQYCIFDCFCARVQFWFDPTDLSRSALHRAKATAAVIGSCDRSTEQCPSDAVWAASGQTRQTILLAGNRAQSSARRTRSREGERVPVDSSNRKPRKYPAESFEKVVLMYDFGDLFNSRLDALRVEGRYRVFADLQR